MSNVNIVWKQAGTVLSVGIKTSIFFVWFFMASVGELNSHIVYATSSHLPVSTKNAVSLGFVTGYTPATSS
jgi:hypothetical protein